MNELIVGGLLGPVYVIDCKTDFTCYIVRFIPVYAAYVCARQNARQRIHVIAHTQRGDGCLLLIRIASCSGRLWRFSRDVLLSIGTKGHQQLDSFDLIS